MSSARTVFAFICIGLMLSGCALPPAKIGLAPSVASGVTSSNAVIVIAQQEIVADVERSGVAAAAGGGLLPALIDAAIESSRAETAEEAIVPVRNALVDTEVTSTLRDTLRTSIENAPWLNVKRVEFTQNPATNLAEQERAKGDEDALAIVGARYRLSADFKTLKVAASVRVYPRSQALRAAAKKLKHGEFEPLLIYKQSFEVTEQVESPSSELSAVAARWTAGTPPAITVAIESAVEALGQTLERALSAPYTVN